MRSNRPPKLEPLPEPPPPPPLPSRSTSRAVRIPVQKEDQVEEVREGGRVVMLKVTPPNGPPYYLVDTTGNGNWMRRDSLDDGVRVPMWPIHTFDWRLTCRSTRQSPKLSSPAGSATTRSAGSCRCEPIKAGIENTNYFVTTTQGRYVLTLFERLPAQELPFYLDLMAHLARHGIPCPAPIADLSDQYLGTL